MSKAVIINLMDAENKERALCEALASLTQPYVSEVDTKAFAQIPGAPFAYWSTDALRNVFANLPAFEGQDRTAKVGLQTGDDFRFVRAWWEVSAERTMTGSPGEARASYVAKTHSGKKWVPFAKGGAYSPYFYDLHLVVNWENDGQELKDFKDPVTGKQFSVLRNTDTYFKRGLTWPRRTTSGMSMRPYPAGAIFADKGPVIFVDEPVKWLGLLQSQLFSELVGLQLGAGDAAARSYEVGIIQKTPVPAHRDLRQLAPITTACIDLQRQSSSADETSHIFVLPAVLQVEGATLAERVSAWNQLAAEGQQQLRRKQSELDALVLDLYGLSSADLPTTPTGPSEATEENAEEEDEEPGAVALTEAQAAFSIISYAVGCAFGRWDISRSLHRTTVNLPDPFAPLPTCSPAVLQNDSGLPASPEQVAAEYPIPIAWSGIMPDDRGHADDVASQVPSIINVLNAGDDSLVQEIETAVGTSDLGSWLGDRFFLEHIRRYSKSRRKAPIYWQLRSAKKHYGLWLYYPRLTRDTLYVALRDYVDPKLSDETEALKATQATFTEAKLAGGKAERSLAKQVAAQEEIVQDIAAFRDELKAIADAGYDPDLNDGVLINIAPLHKLVPWKEAAACYKDLKAGKYPWSTMAKRYKFR